MVQFSQERARPFVSPPGFTDLALDRQGCRMARGPSASPRRRVYGREEKRNLNAARLSSRIGAASVVIIFAPGQVRLGAAPGQGKVPCSPAINSPDLQTAGSVPRTVLGSSRCLHR